jgi:hypothetical protein
MRRTKLILEILEGRSHSEVRNPARPEANGIKMLQRTRDNVKGPIQHCDNSGLRIAELATHGMLRGTSDSNSHFIGGS